jgi:hypothetical protein
VVLALMKKGVISRFLFVLLWLFLQLLLLLSLTLLLFWVIRVILVIVLVSVSGGAKYSYDTRVVMAIWVSGVLSTAMIRG